MSKVLKNPTRLRKRFGRVGILSVRKDPLNVKDHPKIPVVYTDRNILVLVLQWTGKPSVSVSRRISK